MPYVERVTKAGNTIEIERYFTSRYKKKGISLSLIHISEPTRP